MKSRKQRFIALLVLAAMMILSIPAIASAETVTSYSALEDGHVSERLDLYLPKGSSTSDNSWTYSSYSSSRYAAYYSGQHLYLDFDFLITDAPLAATIRYNTVAQFSVKKLSSGAPEWYNVPGWHHVTLDISETFDADVYTLTSKLFVDGVQTYSQNDTTGTYHLFTVEGDTAKQAANFKVQVYSLDKAATADAPTALSYENYILGYGTATDYAAHKINYVLNGGAFDKALIACGSVDVPYENVQNYYNSKTSFATLPVPSAENKVFAGWYTDAALTNKVTADNYASVMNGSDVTLFAGWSVSNGVDSASVTLSSDLTLNFYVNAELEQGQTLTAKFTKNGVTTDVTGEILSTSGTVTSHKFSCTDIGPQNIADPVTAEFYVGEELRFSKTYSVLDYLKTIAKDYATADEDLAALANSLITYGFDASDFKGKDLAAYMTKLTEADFDVNDPGIKRSGLSAFSNSTVETIEGNKCVKILGHQAKHVTVINNAFAGATVGKTYRVSFKYNLIHSISYENKKGSWFDVWFGYNTGVAGAARIANVVVPELGTWQTFTFDVVFENADNVGLAIKNEGLGSDNSVNTEEAANVLLIDDVTVYEVPAVAAPAESTKAAPVNSGAAVIKSANVYFDNQNKIVVKYESASAVTAKIDGADVTPVALGDNLYEISTEGIAPTDFDKDFTFTIGDSTLTYSVNAYAFAMKDNAQIGALANAMFGYGAAAEAYIAE